MSLQDGLGIHGIVEYPKARTVKIVDEGRGEENMAQDTFVITKAGIGFGQAVGEIRIPDLWHLFEYLSGSYGKNAIRLRPGSPEMKQAAEEILEVWNLAHSLQRHIIEAK